MGLNETPSANRTHIGIFGKRNAGKSSIINAITGQELAVVSDVKGTTTDPVSKSMELLPLGAVTLIDTPGLDDEGTLGSLRIKKARQTLNKTDIAILVVDGSVGITKEDTDILNLIQAKQIPHLVVINKSDLTDESLRKEPEGIPSDSVIWVSAVSRLHIEELKERIAAITATEKKERPLVRDLVSPLDFVVLVVPIDESAPKGRLILPQQQTIRELLEAGAIPVVVKDTELEAALQNLGRRPALVITDSQVFPKVSAMVPEDIPLTSFSILFARYKGNLSALADGAHALDSLTDGGKVLISEGCTHHRQCNDIGSVKLPNWIREYTKKELSFEFTSGVEFPDDLSGYQMIVHCGGCMLNEREMQYRLKCALDQKIPMTNYGIAIAHMKGILKRSTEPLSL